MEIAPLKCTICQQPIRLHQQLIYTLPSSITSAIASPPKDCITTPKKNDRSIRISSYLSPPSYHSSSFLNSSLSPTTLFHKSVSSLQTSPPSDPRRIDERPALTRSTSFLHASYWKEKEVDKPIITDISQSPDFVKWQETWRHVLGINVPWCIDCWQRVYKETSEEFYQTGEEIVIERLNLNELRTAQDLNKQIEQELERVNSLQQELEELTQENECLQAVTKLIEKDEEQFIRLLNRHYELVNQTVFTGCASIHQIEKKVWTELSKKLNKLQSKTVWNSLFKVEWMNEGVSLDGIDIISSIKTKNYISVQTAFGTLMHMIKILSQYSNIFLQKTCIDGFGYGKMSVSHKDFTNVNRSKFKNGLRTILTAFNEITTFLEETTLFELPYKISNCEFIQRISFIDVSNLNNWSIALKYFIIDISVTSNMIFSK
ncbi:hypothetical protein EDI_193920 [Entamoeba dispar SAW760]|uniref:Uncharacterized protein n=1 Tax=Entamoeba dispar (strain ATCC PRA-260 / SAW760) TaxID=370354 RepID=B0EAC6_ENTDS|nr:uncharacterized protein EDI_193920 [Entamoeba dispar SAW760]EDR28511.1 hypothetical protein EDI_193920 [Entamoeba dispar SAW760]|eukprot:EDR28511.1 hypothetical protein EDI_193920 [Entamoeba dispar SAW760]